MSHSPSTASSSRAARGAAEQEDERRGEGERERRGGREPEHEVGGRCFQHAEHGDGRSRHRDEQKQQILDATPSSETHAALHPCVALESVPALVPASVSPSSLDPGPRQDRPVDEHLERHQREQRAIPDSRYVRALRSSMSRAAVVSALLASMISQREQRELLPADETGDGAGSEGGEREHLEDGRDDLREEVVRQAEQADLPVPRVEPHPPVVPARLENHPLPPLALGDELPHRVRPLGHADAIGQAGDAVAGTAGPQRPVDAEGELDVLAGELARPASELVHEIASPDLEGARGAQHEVVPRPRDPVVEERAKVVERLEGEERLGVRPGEPHAVLHRARRVARDLEEAREADDVRGIADDLTHRA